jgi:excisionase family DNA binding protein
MDTSDQAQNLDLLNEETVSAHEPDRNQHRVPSVANKAEWLSVEDVAKELHLSLSQVYLWINYGKLEAFNLGVGKCRAFYRIRRSSLEKFLEGKIMNAQPQKTTTVRPKRLAKIPNYLEL